MTDEIMKNHCKKVLRRIAWRLQYAAKKRYVREHSIIEETLGSDTTSSVISQIYIQQLLKQLPEKASFIIKSIIIDGMTEEEVSRKLNITRQGVSKCKNKYLRVLAQKMMISA
jgi:DNA-directed RNA polymerase specialized sigma subunit